MRKKIKAILCIFCLLIITIPIPAQMRGAGNVRVTDASGKTRDVKLYDGSYALVIGESNYTNGWDILPGVKTDVAEVSGALRKNGFTVEPEMNLNSDALQARISRFISDYGFGANNRLLIYFAGHGHTQKALDGRDLGYIVPVDAPLPKDELNFKRRAIPMDTVQDYARRIEAKHALFVFDSCFSGKLVSREAMAVPPVIRDDVTYPVRQFITAGAANQAVPDDSIFRKAFVRGLEGEADLNGDGFVTGTELASFLKDKVTNATDRAQTPQYGKIRDIDLERGDFVFITGNKSNTASTVSAQPDKVASNPVSGEAAFWQTIENSTDAADFESYLARSGSGEFSGIYKATAELKLSRLKKAAAAAVWVRSRDLARIILKYDFANSFSEGLADVLIGDFSTGKWGYIDNTGKEIIPVKYDYAGVFAEGLAAVRIGDNKTGKWGYIDKTGREIIPFKYDHAIRFSEGLGRVRIGDIRTGKYGFIDKTGREIIPIKYDFASVFNEGLVQIRVGDDKTGKYGYIDKTGREIIPAKYDYAGSFAEGLAVFRIGDSITGKYGYIDKTGKETIPAKYDYATSFSEGLAAVRIGDSKTGRWGYIDKTGREIIPAKYDYAFGFSEGFAEVRIGDDKTGKRGVIDKTGKEIIRIKYTNIWCDLFWKEGIIGVELNGKKGFVDVYGNEYFDF